MDVWCGKHMVAYKVNIEFQIGFLTKANSYLYWGPEDFNLIGVYLEARKEVFFALNRLMKMKTVSWISSVDMLKRCSRAWEKLSGF